MADSVCPGDCRQKVREGLVAGMDRENKHVLRAEILMFPPYEPHPAKIPLSGMGTLRETRDL